MVKKSSSVRALLLLLFKRRVRMVVTGNSMAPTLNEGDDLLVNPHVSVFDVGQIVAVRDPRNGRKIVKRLADITPDADFIYILGDNPDESTDSRTFGWISATYLIGVVDSRF